MGFMLDEDTLMLMLTCGFGVGATPMIWSEVGDAMNRTTNLRTLIRTFTYVDDFLCGGKQDHVRQAATVVHEIISGVLGPTGLSEKKNVHAQVADILGILPRAHCDPRIRPSNNSSLWHSVWTWLSGFH